MLFKLKLLPQKVIEQTTISIINFKASSFIVSKNIYHFISPMYVAFSQSIGTVLERLPSGINYFCASEEKPFKQDSTAYITKK